MGAATLTSLGGQIQVNGSPTDSTARIILTGGQLFMQNMVAPSLTIGLPWRGMPPARSRSVTTR